MYDNILHKPLNLRPGVSLTAWSILEELLEKDRQNRLGAKEDFVCISFPVPALFKLVYNLKIKPYFMLYLIGWIQLLRRAPDSFHQCLCMKLYSLKHPHIFFHLISIIIWSSPLHPPNPAFTLYYLFDFLWEFFLLSILFKNVWHMFFLIT